LENLGEIVEFEESKTRSEEGILRSLRSCVQKHVARSFFLGSGLGLGRRRDSADTVATGLGRHLYGDRTRPTLVQRRDSADTCTATGLGRQLYGGLMCLYGCGLFVGGGEPGEPAGGANPANLRAGRTRRTCGRGEPGEPSSSAAASSSAGGADGGY
jgi:hypothetical protein